MLTSTGVPVKKRRLSPDRWAPYVFLSPYFILTAAFFLYPLFYAAILSLHYTNGPKHRQFVGLDNFRHILSDPDFYQAMKNTTVFAAASVFIQLPMSLGLAMLLNAKSDRLKGMFRLAIFAPNLVGQVFVGILFMMLFTPRYGLFNRLTQAIFGAGIDARWLGDPNLVMPAIVICSLWMYVGFNMIYFLAALQNIDASLVEAARIDGAGPIQVFWNVTRPAITPVATFVVVTSTIGSFNLYELPNTLLQGAGPNNSGLFAVTYLYGFFSAQDLGTAAAVGWVLAAVIFAISLLQIFISGVSRRDS
ncbi:MAG: sugar ABC transporter permease [Phycisphaerae bacterium]|nr:sugar ABC transporter permease [Phycisphaerae bacterium]MDW8262353.1 sugar ABC transporter permease [Phycisphaerales bacterium]